jgi:membrane glycosyltransferase
LKSLAVFRTLKRGKRITKRVGITISAGLSWLDGSFLSMAPRLISLIVFVGLTRISSKILTTLLWRTDYSEPLAAG